MNMNQKQKKVLLKQINKKQNNVGENAVLSITKEPENNASNQPVPS
jgi:hypothetical protein